MIIWHRNRRGRGGTTPRCRSRNIANNTFSEGWLQKSNEFAGLRTAPATHHAKNTANTTFSCGMLPNAGFGTIPCGGGGGVVSEPRTRDHVFDSPEKYINSFFFFFFMHQMYLSKLFVLTLTLELFPRKFAAKTHLFTHPRPCRTELGKAGKEHRGIFRVHQFLQSANGWLVLWVGGFGFLGFPYERDCYLGVPPEFQTTNLPSGPSNWHMDWLKTAQWGGLWEVSDGLSLIFDTGKSGVWTVFVGGWNSIMLLAKWYRCSYQDGIRFNEIICFYMFGCTGRSFLAV